MQYTASATTHGEKNGDKLAPARQPRFSKPQAQPNPEELLTGRNVKHGTNSEPESQQSSPAPPSHSFTCICYRCGVKDTAAVYLSCVVLGQ